MPQMRITAVVARNRFVFFIVFSLPSIGPTLMRSRPRIFGGQRHDSAASDAQKNNIFVRTRPQLTRPGLARSADLKDHACARDLNQRSICRIDKTGVTTWATAGIPHGAIIDHISATVRPEPEVSRSVERGRVGSADERLIAAVVAGKILERYRQWCIWVLIEVHQLDFVTDLGRRSGGVG